MIPSFKTYFYQVFLENNNIDHLINRIKEFLLLDHFEDTDDRLTWKQYIDRQQLGECQSIAPLISKNFPQVKHIFGTIENDEYFVDDDGEYNDTPHHWNSFNGMILDFSKGTLKTMTDFIELYSPTVDGDEWRYNDNPLGIK
jgi:hypothetical protein